MKMIIIGDLHFGELGDSEKWNSHLLEFIDHVVEYGDKHEIDTVVQLGDWFHHRNKIQVNTMSYAVEAAKRLYKAFPDVFVLAGNHDLFYKDKLSTSSLASIEAYVDVIDTPTTFNADGKDILLCPWIVDDIMWDDVCSKSSSHAYLLSHLELRGFKLNENYVMEHGFSHKELGGYKRVITGHYHSHQELENITYTGTPLPITMNEANEDHGFFVLDTETDELEFIKYDKVKVLSIPYDEVEMIKDLDPAYTTVRVEFPDTLEDETLITDVQEYMQELGFEPKVKYTSKKVKDILEASEGVTVEDVEDIDAVVKTFLGDSFDVDGVDKDRLLKLYNLAMSS